jgi:hypothetical protein
VNKYLDRFPAKHHKFIHNRFSQAYVFSEQSYEYGSDDSIDLAAGPLTMKSRVVASCEELLDLVDDELRGVLAEVIETINESDDLLKEVKGEIDARWQEAQQYMKANPPKERKAEKPTDSQLSFLKSLGCSEVPTSKAEASKLIERYKKNGNTKKRFR